MKKGKPLKPMLQKINEDSKRHKDYIVNLKDLQMFSAKLGKQIFPRLKVNEQCSGTLNDHALGKLCRKLQIPANYIRLCLPWGNVVVDNLNHWIDVTKDRKLMIRVRENGSDTIGDNVIRAVLSDRYKRLDNDLVANKTLDKLMDMKAEIKYASYNGDQLNLTAVTPELSGEVKVGDTVQGGITITNCEVGTQSLLIQPFIYRLVCSNGMVAPRYLNRFYAKHVGKVLIDLDKDDQAIKIIHKMQKQLELVSNPELFQENLQKLKDATNVTTHSTKVVQLFKHHSLSDWERKEVFQRLDNHIVGDSFTTDNYTLSNAITNVANHEEVSEDRARFLQELGGLIIFAHNPNAIKLR